MSMERSATAHGTGKLTVKALRELLVDIPEEAVLSISASNGSQRDPEPYWQVSAKWGAVTNTTEQRPETIISPSW